MDVTLETGKPYKELITLRQLTQEGASVQAKRVELYKHGGAYATTFRPLLLDLLSQKLSASNISGVIINDCQRVRQEASNEKFLTNLLKRENPDCRVICYSSNAREIARGGQQRVERLMKWLRVDHLELYPRIKSSVKESLDDLKGLNITEHEIAMTPTALKIHGLLLKLLKSILTELAAMFRR